MKKIIAVLLSLFIIVMSASGQYDLRPKYQNKVEHYKHMRTSGLVLTGLGAGFAAGGTILVLYGSDKLNSIDYHDPYYSEEDEAIGALSVVGGAISMIVSIPLLTSGIILASVGSHKSHEYQKRLQGLTMGVICTPKVQGLSLVYRF
jgi:hypothetical protein